MSLELNSLESLIQIATGQGEVMEMVRQMIGTAELALLIANSAVADTSIKLRPCNVASAIGMSEDGARKKIDNTIVRTGGASGMAR